jgi:hypothetical protein
MNSIPIPGTVLPAVDDGQQGRFSASAWAVERPHRGLDSHAGKSVPCELPAGSSGLRAPAARRSRSAGETGNEGCGAPVAVPHGGDGTGARRAPPVAPREVGRGAALVKEHEPRGAARPARAAAWPRRRADPARRLFLMPHSDPAESVLWIVESPTARPKRRPSSAWSSTSVISRCARDQPSALGFMGREQRAAMAASERRCGAAGRAQPRARSAAAGPWTSVLA